MIAAEATIIPGTEQIKVKIHVEGALELAQMEAIGLFHSIAAQLNRDFDGNAGTVALGAALYGTKVHPRGISEPIETEGDHEQVSGV